MRARRAEPGLAALAAATLLLPGAAGGLPRLPEVAGLEGAPQRAGLEAVSETSKETEGEKAKEAGGEKAKEGAPGPGREGAEKPPATPAALDFDLLAPPPPPKPADEEALRRRRRLLTWHQGFGIGLAALAAANGVVGQLSYTDRFAGGPSTARYQETHRWLAFGSAAALAVTGSLALFAPPPERREGGFDRMTLHKVAMFTAAAGMAAELGLGLYVRSREGYLDQEKLATVHLAIGYAVLGAIATGVGAIVL